MLRHRPSALRSPIRAALACALVAIGFAGPASAGEVYQWTDANGVTHYSQTPPPSGSAKYRVISHRQPEAAAPGATAAAEDPQCGVARANIALIEGGGRVQRDTDGDGAPDRDLTQVERDSQLQLAKLVLRTNCTPPAETAASEQGIAPEGADQEGVLPEGGE